MLITASVVATPPKKPRRLAKTIPGSKNFFTIHTTPNAAFTLKVNEQARTSVVGFKDWDDAFFISKMIETHFVHQKEWPDTKSEGHLILPFADEGDVLQYLYIQKWDFDDLKLECTKNFLDLIGVDGIIKKKIGGYTLDGKVYKFEAEWDFYRLRLKELWFMNE